MASQQNTTRLFVEIRATVDRDRIPSILQTSDWLGVEIAPDERGMRQFACDLTLNAGAAAPISFRKSMILAAGDPVSVDPGWRIPVEWRSATMSPLFPVFVGTITIGVARINVDGWYAPPFGAVGTVLDRSVMHIAARATARYILRTFVSALGATVQSSTAIERTPRARFGNRIESSAPLTRPNRRSTEPDT